MANAAGFKLYAGYLGSKILTVGKEDAVFPIHRPCDGNSGGKAKRYNQDISWRIYSNNFFSYN